MEPRSLVALIVKTAGLLLIIYTLALSPERVADYALSGERSGYLLAGFVVLPIVVPLLIGALLFAFPAITAGAVAGANTAASSDLERMLQAVIFAGIGLYVGVQGALDVAYYASLHAFTMDEYAVAPFDDPINRAGLISSVLSLIIGGVLLVSSRGFSALVAKVRYGS